MTFPNLKEEKKASINVCWKKNSQIQGRNFFYKNLSWKKKPGHPTHHPAFQQVHQPTHQSSNPPGLVIPVFFKSPGLLSHQFSHPPSLLIPTVSITKTITHWVYLQPNATQTPTKDTPKPNQGQQTKM